VATAFKVKVSGRSGLRWRLLPLAKRAFDLLGRRWNDFYAWMLDRQERRNSIDNILRRTRHVEGKDKGLYDVSRGPVHLDYMKAQGLKPHHRLLDFGCGYGRTAVHLLPYLEPGNYIGVDLSRERIRICDEYIAKLGLTDRKATFRASKDNRLGNLADGSIDVIWCHSVITHMPLPEIGELVAGARRVLATGGQFLFTYAAADEYRCDDLKDFYYPPRLIEELAARHGFDMAVLEDWEQELSPEHRHDYIRMVRLTPAKESG